MRRSHTSILAFGLAAEALFGACQTDTKSIGTVPVSQRAAPLTPGDRTTLVSQGASCAPNATGPVLCTWSNGQVSCDLTFDANDQLTDLRCKDSSGVTFACTRPSDEYVCTWSDDTRDCGDVYDGHGVFIGYLCDADLDAHRHHDGGTVIDAGTSDGGVPTSDGGVVGPLEWRTACGPPVCGPNDPQNRQCTASETKGSPCTTEFDRCQMGTNSCTGILACTTQDINPSMCPISKREYKRDIRYMSEAEIHALKSELLDLKLTKYVYKADPHAREQLGFIIDDGVPDALVNREASEVNLYGYTSLAVAALQAQQKEIARLEREIDDLKARIEPGAGVCYPTP
jgi:hypothetical protein